MQRSESFSPSSRPIPLALILMAAVAIHLPLLLMKLPLKSFDTNFHILFASDYVHHWFDPWNPKWYAGFSQMTYPPLPQQWVASIERLRRDRDRHPVRYRWAGCFSSCVEAFLTTDRLYGRDTHRANRSAPQADGSFAPDRASVKSGHRQSGGR